VRNAPLRGALFAFPASQPNSRERDMVEKMDPKIKPLWLAALRGGEYSQGEGYLNRNGKFCCLGVLCDLAAKAGVDIDIVEHSVLGEDNATTYDSNWSSLPQSVIDWSGVESGGDFPDGVQVVPADMSEGFTGKLWELNDVAEWNFEQIADFIEEHF
jgi:hypothetical protein